jgi:tRNA(fMet)-specific endonuclease VapC
LRHLDTDTAVAYLRGRPAAVERLKTSLPDVAISTPAAGELLYGALASAQPQAALSAVRHLLDIVEIVPFDRDAAEAYGRIRVALRRAGRPSGRSTR